MEHQKQSINEYRSILFSIGYNMLGTVADAEDIVQETFVSWLNSDKLHVENVKFYLIRTVSNKCITHLKKLKLQREFYKGTWLTEPLLSNADTDNSLEIKDNLSIKRIFRSKDNQGNMDLGYVSSTFIFPIVLSCKPLGIPAMMRRY